MNPLNVTVHIEVMEIKKYCEVCKVETIHQVQVIFVGNSFEPIETGIKFCELCFKTNG